MTFKLEHPLPYGLDERTRSADFWPTPRHCVDSLLAVDPPPPERVVLDPCAGDGAIIRVLQEHGYTCNALEIRESERVSLQKLCPTHIGNFLEEPFLLARRCSVLTNPPFSLAVHFARKCMDCPWVALLLRCNVIGSNTWASLWDHYPPSAIYPLKRRPSFSGDGKTDASEYAWFVWEHTRAPMELKPI